MKTPRAILTGPGASGLLRGDKVKSALLGVALALALMTPRVGLAEISEAEVDGWVPTPLNPGLQLPHHRYHPYLLAQSVQNPGSVAPTPGSPAGSPGTEGAAAGDNPR